MAFKWALIKRILQAFEIQKENPPHLGAGNKLVTKDEIKNRVQMETYSRGFGQFITKSDAQATKVRLQRKLKDKKLVTKLPKTGNKRVTKCVK